MGDSLKQLIDLAVANGWRHPYSEILESNTGDSWVRLLVHPTANPKIDFEWAIIFDPEFIKALCRAVELDDLGAMLSPNPNWDLELDPWELVLCELAIAPDRIAYLREEFLE